MKRLLLIGIAFILFLSGCLGTIDSQGNIISSNLTGATGATGLTGPTGPTGATGNFTSGDNISVTTANITTLYINGFNPFGFLDGGMLISSQASIDKKVYGNFLNWLGFNVWVCDGIDDNIQIQTAINNTAAINGGNVWLNSGNYSITSQVEMKSNVYLQGTISSILRLADNTLSNVVNFGEASIHDSGISGFTIDGNSSNNTETADHSIRQGFHLSASNPRRITIDKMTIHDTALGNIINPLTTAGYEISVTNSKFYGTTGTSAAPIEYMGIASGVISNNTIVREIINQHPSIELQDTNSVVVSNNFIHGSGFLIFDSSYNTITGNTIVFPSSDGTVWEGIAFTAFVAGQPNRLNNFVGNTFSGVGQSNEIGIDISTPNSNTYQNTFSSNTFFNMGIAINSYNENNSENSFLDNQIYTVTQGIVCSTSDNLFRGNTIVGTSSWGMNFSAVAGHGNCDRNKIIGNTFRGMGVGSLVHDSTGHDTVIIDNDFRGTTEAGFLTVSTSTVNRNKGFVTENSGSSVGTGVQQTVAHGLAITPAKQQIGVFSDNFTGIAFQTATPDATNIYITSTNNSAWHWATIGN